MLCVLALFVVGQALTPSSYLTRADLERLRAVFSATLPYGTADMQSIHYSILGFSLLDDSIPEPQVCQLPVSASGRVRVGTICGNLPFHHRKLVSFVRVSDVALS